MIFECSCAAARHQRQSGWFRYHAGGGSYRSGAIDRVCNWPKQRYRRDHRRAVERVGIAIQPECAPVGARTGRPRFSACTGIRSRDRIGLQHVGSECVRVVAPRTSSTFLYLHLLAVELDPYFLGQVAQVSLITVGHQPSRRLPSGCGIHCMHVIALVYRPSQGSPAARWQLSFAAWVVRLLPPLW